MALSNITADFYKLVYIIQDKTSLLSGKEKHEQVNSLVNCLYNLWNLCFNVIDTGFLVSIFLERMIEAEGFHQHLIKKKLESTVKLTIASLYYKVLTTQNVN